MADDMSMDITSVELAPAEGDSKGGAGPK